VQISPQIAYAGGGDYNRGIGRIWKTTNGGQSWSVELYIPAEIRTLQCVRTSTAYVSVVAAGVYPDFRGGIWRQRLYLPDSSAAMIVTLPATLNFGNCTAGAPDTLWTTLRNNGQQSDTITGIFSAGPFAPIWSQTYTPIAPGQEITLRVVFSSDVAGEFAERILVRNQHTGRVELFCTARISEAASPQDGPMLPAALRLNVWPNPGNAVFGIRFDLPRAADVRLRVFDLAGRLVETLADARLEAGEHVQSWDAVRHASGIYFLRLDLPQGAVTQKILLVK
jgi:hypothetical protein